MGRIAAYVRASTEKQVDDHQRDAIENWADEEDEEILGRDWFVDVGSGAKDDREQFQELLTAIEADAYDRVVLWEISRISRKGATLQEFFDLCEETGTIVTITNGSVEEVRPDGHGRFVADIIGMVYQEERRTLIRRIEAGVERAQKEGKWLGQVPAGFIRDDAGYLQPNLDPDHSEGEVGYIELRKALERIETEDESYRSAADGLPVTRQTLMNIHQDEERLSWYLNADAEDSRVDEALSNTQTDVSESTGDL